MSDTRPTQRTEANAAKYTFAALFVNQAMVPLIIYSFIEVLEGFPVLFQGQYTDFETAWYNKVMVTIMSTAMVNIVAFPMGAAMPNIIAMVQRWFTGCCAHSQKKLNEMYVPSEFSLAKRYGQMLCALFYTIIFLSAAPPLIPGACILFMALYVTDKMILLKFSKRPPMYDHKLNAQFLKFAPYAAWVHCALATWAFGYYEIPSYIVDPGDIVGKVGVDSDNLALLNENEVNDADLSGKPDQFEFMARLVRANALICSPSRCSSSSRCRSSLPSSSAPSSRFSARRRARVRRRWTTSCPSTSSSSPARRCTTSPKPRVKPTTSSRACDRTDWRITPSTCAYSRRCSPRTTPNAE